MRSRKSILRMIERIERIFEETGQPQLDLHDELDVVLMVVSFYTGLLWAIGERTEDVKKAIYAIKVGAEVIDRPYTGPEPSEN